jgi:hypothetical protein
MGWVITPLIMNWERSKIEPGPLFRLQIEITVGIMNLNWLKFYHRKGAEDAAWEFVFFKW